MTLNLCDQAAHGRSPVHAGRQLAGYFTSRAVEMQTHNGAIAQKGWGTAEWTKQGAMYAYSQAAVRLAE